MIVKNCEYSINDLIPIIEECIANGTNIRMSVRGMSMYPFLRDRRDSVVLSKPENLKKYDIVLHKRSENKYIMHRIIGKKGSVLTIAGDLEMEKEYPVNEYQVVAKVVSFNRDNKIVDCNSFSFKFLSFLWVLAFPIRGILISSWLKFRRITNGKG